MERDFQKKVPYRIWPRCILAWCRAAFFILCLLFGYSFLACAYSLNALQQCAAAMCCSSTLLLRCVAVYVAAHMAATHMLQHIWLQRICCSTYGCNAYVAANLVQSIAKSWNMLQDIWCDECIAAFYPVNHQLTLSRLPT